MQDTLGHRLTTLRHERDLRLVDVSDAAGLSVSWINDLEHDRAAPSLDTLIRLAAAYGVTPVQLLEGLPPYDHETAR